MPSVNYLTLVAQLGVIGTVSGEEIRAPCPLHSDRNPSFSINVATGLWTCFSRCGSGNFQQLVEKKLNYTWQEAREWIDSNGSHMSLEDMMETMTARTAPPVLIPAEQPATHWLTQYESLTNQQMPEWLLDRGISWESVNHFGMRYNIVMDSVVFPAMWNGEMVGTITRNTDPSKPKYQNSDNFPRDRIFYGEIKRDQTTIILCEGVLDAVWFWQLGYHGVSVLGESLTQGQIGVLRDYRFGSIVLAFDNDEAGINGTRRAVDGLVKAGWLWPQIKRIRFPGNYRNKGTDYRKDAQECTPELLATLYEQREDVIGL